MDRNIITTLGFSCSEKKECIYFDTDNGLNYASAYLPTLGGVEYILSKYPVDNIIVFGRASYIGEVSSTEYSVDADNNTEQYTDSSNFTDFCGSIENFIKFGETASWYSLAESGNIPQSVLDMQCHRQLLPEGLKALDVNRKLSIHLITIDDHRFELSHDELIAAMESVLNFLNNKDYVLYLDTTDFINIDSSFIIGSTIRASHEIGVDIPCIVSSLSVGPNCKKLSNDRDKYEIDNLVAGVSAFVNYGKVSVLREFWEKRGLFEAGYGQIIEAMEYISDGISLSNVADFETGLNRLRLEIRHLEELSDCGSENYVILSVLVDRLKKDYGVLLESDDPETLDILKWMIRKDFLQQAMTVAESLIPSELVKKGVFYYAQNEDDLEKYKVSLYDEYRRTTGSKSKFQDLDRYFICYYRRGESSYKADKLMNYASFRVSSLTECNDETASAYTNLDDSSQLTELLYQYYLLAELRDHLNHAADTLGDYGKDTEESNLFVNGNRRTILDCLNKFTDLYSYCTNQLSSKKAPSLFLKKTDFDSYVNKCAPKSNNKKIGSFTTLEIKNDPYEIDGLVEYNSTSKEIVIRITQQ